MARGGRGQHQIVSFDIIWKSSIRRKSSTVVLWTNVQKFGTVAIFNICLCSRIMRLTMLEIGNGRQSWTLFASYFLNQDIFYKKSLLSILNLKFSIELTMIYELVRDRFGLLRCWTIFLLQHWILKPEDPGHTGTNRTADWNQQYITLVPVGHHTGASRAADWCQ